MEDNILSDPSNLDMADQSANSGDGSAAFDPNTTDGSMTPGDWYAADPVTFAPLPTGTTAASSGSGIGDFFYGLFGGVTPVLTAAGAAAAGALATQATTAKNPVRSNTTTAAPGSLSSMLQGNGIILAVIGILLAVLFLGRKK